MIKTSLYSSYPQSHSVTVTISPSFRVRPLASYRCQARTGSEFNLLISRFFRKFFDLPKKIVLPYRYFNEFLVLYSGFPDSRQADLMKFLFCL
nr:MAG TPA: hypothetical protein [Caudoviricetes sp.]